MLVKLIVPRIEIRIASSEVRYPIRAMVSTPDTMIDRSIRGSSDWHLEQVHVCKLVVLQ